MRVRCAALAVLLVVWTGRAAAQEFDPRLAFVTVRTDHFRFHFHDSGRPLVDALIPIAEAAWVRFDDRGTNPPALTDVVVTDQSDAPNGSATPLPRNRIVLFAAPPTPGLHLNPVDWLSTIFVHEFTHIVHLNQSGGWAAAGRHIFGRAPFVFPNLFLPVWQIEGLATFEESRGAGAGRLHAGAFRVLTEEAARAQRVPPLDRINGGVSDWPSGLAPYAWGADFHAFLASRNGDTSLDSLASRTASRLPWLGSRAFRRVYGASLGQLWREYADAREVEARHRQEPSPPPARRLTFHGHLVGAARFTPPSCATCDSSLTYSIQTPDERPAIYQLAWGSAGESRRLTTRYGGSTLAADVHGTIYFDQIETVRNAGRYADLYAFDRATGRTRQLTHEARLLDPDVSPDGARAVAVEHTGPGTRRLVLVDIASGSVRPVTASGSRDAYSTPRLSPDQTTIVAIRQTHAEASDLVLVDVASGSTRVLAQGGRSMWAMPTWHPDGRHVVVSRSVNGAAFTLVDVEVATGILRSLTSVASGALWPEVSPDGATIVYTGYTVDGYDLYAIDYRPRPVNPAGDGAAAASPPLPAAAVSANATAVPYSPWPTLLPTSWTPLVETDDGQIRAGIATMGRDVLGYHAWSASATWRVADDFDENGFGTTADWAGTYAYRRSPFQPFLAAWRQTDDLFVQFAATGLTRHVAAVERGWQAGFAWQVLHNRRANVVEASLLAVDEQWRASGERGSRDRSAFRAAWRYNTSYVPGYGISPERGLRAGTAVEFITPRLGASAAAGTAAFDARAYAPGFGRHDVLAARVSVATTWGDDRVRRAFALGGGDAAPFPGTLGSDAGPLLRGFPPTAFVGRHTAGLDIDYRFPIARPQRGVGTWPALLHSLHGAVIADLAHVWINRFDGEALKTSVGGELSADVIAGYATRLTITGGIAWGNNRASGARWSPTAYVRVGRAF